MKDLLETMRHGHACPIANEHYAWAVAEIDRLRDQVANFKRMMDEVSYSDLIASGGIVDAP